MKNMRTDSLNGKRWRTKRDCESNERNAIKFRLIAYLSCSFYSIHYDYIGSLNIYFAIVSFNRHSCVGFQSIRSKINNQNRFFFISVVETQLMHKFNGQFDWKLNHNVPCVLCITSRIQSAFESSLRFLIFFLSERATKFGSSRVHFLAEHNVPRWEWNFDFTWHFRVTVWNNGRVLAVRTIKAANRVCTWILYANGMGR